MILNALESVEKDKKQHPNPIATYDPLNHGTTNTLFLDSSGNGNHATMSGFNNNSWLADGSLKFNGTNTLITTPISQTIFNDPNGGSVETVIDFGTRSSFRGVAGDSRHITDNGFFFMQSDLYYGEVMGFGFYGGNSLGIPISHIPADYAHCLMSYDRSSIKVYVNGILVGQNSAGVITVPNWPILIGRSLNASNRYTDGRMKEFNIYNSALTASDVLENYNNYKKKGLVA